MRVARATRRKKIRLALVAVSKRTATPVLDQRVHWVGILTLTGGFARKSPGLFVPAMSGLGRSICTGGLAKVIPTPLNPDTSGLGKSIWTGGCATTTPVPLVPFASGLG